MFGSITNQLTELKELLEQPHIPTETKICALKLLPQSARYQTDTDFMTFLSLCLLRAVNIGLPSLYTSHVHSAIEEFCSQQKVDYSEAISKAVFEAHPQTDLDGRLQNPSDLPADIFNQFLSYLCTRAKGVYDKVKSVRPENWCQQVFRLFELKCHFPIEICQFTPEFDKPQVSVMTTSLCQYSLSENTHCHKLNITHLFFLKHQKLHSLIQALLFYDIVINQSTGSEKLIFLTHPDFDGFPNQDYFYGEFSSLILNKSVALHPQYPVARSELDHSVLS
ncbi:hypothetical protein D5018_21360 [Parashewanella curva]|uniref:Uncharacterized protein n=1 Tax=Parashewanella curva TaxID=2338552 RepID=A0A3L8PQL1_9GAMM|nr:hypothetical protein [Parashewanella curva]RLV57667.1 hypothetical protein D5018_21360 [Parashewanella curva]